MISDEHDLAELLKLKRRRLRELERTVARYGNDAPPHVVTERDDLQAELEQDSSALEPVINGELSNDALAALRAYGIPASVKSALQNFEQRLYDLNRAFQQFRENQERLRDDERKLREERQLETDKQRDHVNVQLIKINLYVRLTSGLLFLIAVAGVVYFVLRVFFATYLASLGR